MNLIDDHPLQAVEHMARVLVRGQKRQAFRCREQDMRRIGPLAFSLGLGRVPGPVFNADRQADFIHRRAQVALDICGQGFQRRDIERVETLMGAIGQFGQRRQKPGHGFAAARRRDEKLAGLS